MLKKTSASRTQKCIGLPKVISIKWQPPEQGWFKLNTDGSSRSNPGLAGVGVVVHNSDGLWIV
ncbi:hypothetical protein ES288_D06G105900v1 [Gossypium darwinii]|uniref:RNase H type-1 domain-containing protein n=1 Tax=Gossypium darwinii TaxID=34276 RepID=A0A5D2C457_GOSDA|nr:hypothetical protein ES288_D06G105900v1 [Gossypium darwinii]